MESFKILTASLNVEGLRTPTSNANNLNNKRTRLSDELRLSNNNTFGDRSQINHLVWLQHLKNHFHFKEKESARFPERFIQPKLVLRQYMGQM
jgi:hypothetical protein